MKVIRPNLTANEVEFIETISKLTGLSSDEIIRRSVDMYVRWFMSQDNEKLSLEYWEEYWKYRENKNEETS